MPPPNLLQPLPFLLLFLFLPLSPPFLSPCLSLAPLHSSHQACSPPSIPIPNALSPPASPRLFSTRSARPWRKQTSRWSLAEALLEYAGTDNGTVLIQPPNPASAYKYGREDDLRDWTLVELPDLTSAQGYDGADDPDSSVARTSPIRQSTGLQPGHTVWLVLWLLLLFYMLGTTASDYFSCILEKLSGVLRLSPAVAGVTLLAIGNGAPDVFSSVAAFVSSDESGSIGFGCVLGGALFITTVVSGTVALVTAKACKTGCARLDMVCFVRDALFLLASAAVLTIIILDEKVYLWEAIAFLCVYLVYASSVWAAEIVQSRRRHAPSLLDPLLVKSTIENSLPQWSPHTHHCHYLADHGELAAEHFLDSMYDLSFTARFKHLIFLFYKYGIEWPLALPQRLTIPMVEEDHWSRVLAVVSCTLGPPFVGAVCIFHFSDSTESNWTVFGVTSSMGVALGLLAFFSTENGRPPQRFLWLWLTGGFFMSIVWFYLIADELVTSLETIGDLFSISPAILGLTVLAWGNSIGDLVADLTLACSGRDGVQIAISGCYAGPLFNTVVGLGLSLVVACWQSSPEPLLVDNDDNSLFYIIGFLGAGLAWALVMMPLKSMRLSRSFGVGLVLLYCGFLVTGVCYALGWISQ